MNDTICAIATPIGLGSVSIVRLSGSNALNIASNFFKPCGNGTAISPRTVILGNFFYENFNDKVILIHFKSPKSFTGEDVVEIQCHGGPVITSKIIEACIKFGARLAQNGEFSKRAFINGKISLDEAEGIIDTILAESDAELVSSNLLQSGKLKEKVRFLQNEITSILATINVSLDYPEHDDENKIQVNISSKIDEFVNDITALIKSFFQGKLLKYGISVVILGKPNVGKSSLLNALIGENRAIVSSVAGTTRDIINETIVHDGLKIKFIDTAGIRETEEFVEKIGIEKAKNIAKESDIIIKMFDLSSDFNSFDKEILSLCEDKPCIIVFNKSDLPQVLNMTDFNNFCSKNFHNIAKNSFDVNKTPSYNFNSAESNKSCVDNLKTVQSEAKTYTLYDLKSAKSDNFTILNKSDFNEIKVNDLKDINLNDLIDMKADNFSVLKPYEIAEYEIKDISELKLENVKNLNKSKFSPIYISAENNKNIELILESIKQKAKFEKIDTNSLVITNARHKEALEIALKKALEIKNNNFATLDILSFEFKELWNALGLITGESENETIIDAIFSKFCLGK